MTTQLIHQLPTWTSHRHNASTKYEMYLRLAHAYRFVLTEIGKRVHAHGKVFPASVVREWADQIKQHVMHLMGGGGGGGGEGGGNSFGFDGDLVNVFRRQLGWLAESVVRLLK